MRIGSSDTSLVGSRWHSWRLRELSAATQVIRDSNAEITWSGISTITTNRGKPSEESNLSRAGTSMRYIWLISLDTHFCHRVIYSDAFSQTLIEIIVNR